MMTVRIFVPWLCEDSTQVTFAEAPYYLNTKIQFKSSNIRVYRMLPQSTGTMLCRELRRLEIVCSVLYFNATQSKLSQAACWSCSSELWAPFIIVQSKYCTCTSSSWALESHSFTAAVEMYLLLLPHERRTSIVLITFKVTTVVTSSSWQNNRWFAAGDWFDHNIG